MIPDSEWPPAGTTWGIDEQVLDEHPPVDTREPEKPRAEVPAGSSEGNAVTCYFITCLS